MQLRLSIRSVLILLFFQKTLWGLACPQVFFHLVSKGLQTTSEKWNRLRLAKEFKNFDDKAYAEALAKYEGLLQNPSHTIPNPPFSPEEKAAFVQLLLSPTKIEPGRFNNSDLAHPTRELRIQANHLAGMNFKSGVVSLQPEWFIADYLMSQTVPPSLLSLLTKAGWQNAVKTTLLDHYASEFENRKVTDALEQMDAFRDPSNREKLMHFLLSEKGGFKQFFKRIKGLFGEPLEPLPDNLYERALQHGLNSIYPDLKREFKNNANFELAWSTAKRLFALGVNTSISTWMIAIQYNDELKKKKEAEANTAKFEKDLEELSTFAQHPSVSDELREDYRKQFFEMFNRDPTLEDPAYRILMELKSSSNTSE